MCFVFIQFGTYNTSNSTLLVFRKLCFKFIRIRVLSEVCFILLLYCLLDEKVKFRCNVLFKIFD